MKPSTWILGLTTVCVLAAIVVTSLVNVSAAPKSSEAETDPKSIVQAMSDYLNKAKSTRTKVNLHATFKNVPSAEEQKSTVEIRFEQPNRFVLHNHSDSSISMYSDGKEVVTYVPELKRYTVDKAPSATSEIQGFVDSPFAFGMPGIDHVKQVFENVDSTKYVGEEKVGKVNCHHVRIDKGDQWDFWIESGSRPKVHKLRITQSLADQGVPDGLVLVNITLTDWAIDYKPKDADFAFSPTKDDEKVDSLFPEPGRPHDLLGKAAPALKLDLLAGGKMDLKNHKDKEVVILDFWATWCGPCVRALPTISKVAGDFKKRGVAFYAINLQEMPEDVTSFLKSQGLDLPVALDRSGAAAQAYYASAIPQTVIIGKDGTVQAVHVGLLPNLEEQLSDELETLVSGKSLVE